MWDPIEMRGRRSGGGVTRYKLRGTVALPPTVPGLINHCADSTVSQAPQKVLHSFRIPGGCALPSCGSCAAVLVAALSADPTPREIFAAPSLG